MNKEVSKIKLSSVTAKIDDKLKHDVESILNTLGLNHSVAINMFYNQIKLTNSIPFSLAIPEAKPVKRIKSKIKKVKVNRQ